MGKDKNSIAVPIARGFQIGVKFTGKILMTVILVLFSMLAIIASPLLMWMHRVETTK